MTVDFKTYFSEIQDKEIAPIKIVLFGPESTGKSTLAEMLAKAFNTEWNPEFLRHYLEKKELLSLQEDPRASFSVEEDEVIKIALGQLKSELETIEIDKPLVFFDTCLHTNVVYAVHYFGRVPQQLFDAAFKQPYDFFLLCDTDLPWVADPQRDGVEVQKILFAKMRNYLVKYDLPFAVVDGNEEDRINKAIKCLKKQFPNLIKSNPKEV